MKAILCLALASLAVAQVLGEHSLYDEKEDAKNAIEKKYKEFLDEIQKSKDFMKNEKSTCDSLKPTIENEVKDASKKGNETMESFKKKIIAAMRTAIAKGKPLATFNCIEDVPIEGRQQLNKIVNDYKFNLENSVNLKEKVLSYAETIMNDIKTATDELKSQFFDKLNQTKIAEVEKLKKDGIQKIGNAMKVINDIGKSVLIPNMNLFFNDLKTGVGKKIQGMEESMESKLKKCIS